MSALVGALLVVVGVVAVLLVALLGRRFTAPDSLGREFVNAFLRCTPADHPTWSPQPTLGWWNEFWVTFLHRPLKRSDAARGLPASATAESVSPLRVDDVRPSPGATARRSLTGLERALGVGVDVALLNLALTHRSHAYENGDIPSNERLKFFGDALLGFVVTEHLYRIHPDLPESKLAMQRASIVNAHSLAGVARGVGLGEHLLLGHDQELTGGRDRNHILADALEAVIGAVYLDLGIESAVDLVHRLFKELFRSEIGVLTLSEKLRNRDSTPTGQQASKMAGSATWQVGTEMERVKRLRVLIVDDHPVVRRGLRAMLEGEPWVEAVAEAATVAEAVKEAAIRQVHVVAMDVALPDGDGIDAARTILRAHPDTHVLVLTMTDDEDVVVRAFEAGARGYLLKDTDPETVLDALRTVAAGGVVLGSRIAVAIFSATRRQPARLPPPLDQLTAREYEILTLLAAGKSNARIARRLGLSEKTVRNQLSRIFSKLGVADRVQAAAFARRIDVVE